MRKYYNYYPQLGNEETRSNKVKILAQGLKTPQWRNLKVNS